MNTNRIFPNDFTKDEIINFLSDLSNRLDSTILTEGERINIERKMTVCQNHLIFLSLIDSNEKLTYEQQILVKQQNSLLEQQETLKKLFIESGVTSKRTALEAKVIIILTIITLLATSAIEVVHMEKESKSHEKIIQQLDSIIKNTEYISAPMIMDTLNHRSLKPKKKWKRKIS